VESNTAVKKKPAAVLIRPCIQISPSQTSALVIPYASVVCRKQQMHLRASVPHASAQDASTATAESGATFGRQFCQVLRFAPSSWVLRAQFTGFPRPHLFLGPHCPCTHVAGAVPSHHARIAKQVIILRDVISLHTNRDSIQSFWSTKPGWRPRASWTSKAGRISEITMMQLTTHRRVPPAALIITRPRKDLTVPTYVAGVARLSLCASFAAIYCTPAAIASRLNHALCDTALRPILRPLKSCSGCCHIRAACPVWR
jgi:hypothetical protein